MQDLETLEGKTIVELREIAKSLGIVPSTMKKQELFEKIVAFATGAMEQGDVSAEPQQEVEPQEAPRRGRRPRMASVRVSETTPKTENTIINKDNTTVVEVNDVTPMAEQVVVEAVQEVTEEQTPAPAPTKRRGRKPKAAVVEEAVEVAQDEVVETPVVEQVS